MFRRKIYDKLSTNLGYLYENAVTQALVANGRELFFLKSEADK